jgi:hypothetical protein
LCLLAHRALDPPPSSSLAKERTPLLPPPPRGGARFPTLAGRLCPARAVSNCSLRSRGSRSEAAAFLAHSQTKGVSARSFVQNSGARSAVSNCSLRSRGSRSEAAAFLAHSQTKTCPLARSSRTAARDPQCLIARCAREAPMKRSVRPGWSSAPGRRPTRSCVSSRLANSAPGLDRGRWRARQ